MKLTENRSKEAIIGCFKRLKAIPKSGPCIEDDLPSRFLLKKTDCLLMSYNGMGLLTLISGLHSSQYWYLIVWRNFPTYKEYLHLLTDIWRAILKVEKVGCNLSDRDWLKQIKSVVILVFWVLWDRSKKNHIICSQVLKTLDICCDRYVNEN